MPPETLYCARTTPYFHHLGQPRRQPKTIAHISLRIVVFLQEDDILGLSMDTWGDGRGCGCPFQHITAIDWMVPSSQSA